MKAKNIFLNGLILDNPILVQFIGCCPTLATTTAAKNGLVMGLATMFVLICSNVIISAIRKLVPDKVRIPCYIVVIATFVTIVDMFLEAFMNDMYQILGLFIPLIVVNCIILARAEGFASKNKVLPSALDGFSMGLGFTCALLLLGIIREFLGAGTIFGMTVVAGFTPMTIFILAPGAFLTMACIVAVMNFFKDRKKSA